MALTRSQATSVAPLFSLAGTDSQRARIAPAARAQQALVALLGRAQAEFSRVDPNVTPLGRSIARRRFAQQLVDGDVARIGAEVAAVEATAAEAEAAFARTIDQQVQRLSAAEIASAQADANYFNSGTSKAEDVSQFVQAIRDGDRAAIITGMMIGQRTPIGRQVHALARRQFGKMMLASVGKDPAEVEELTVAAGVLRLQFHDVAAMIRAVAGTGEDANVTALQVATRWAQTQFDELVAEGQRMGIIERNEQSIGRPTAGEANETAASNAAALLTAANQAAIDAARRATTGGTHDALGRVHNRTGIADASLVADRGAPDQ